jgi:hypothetical protein
MYRSSSYFSWSPALSKVCFPCADPRSELVVHIVRREFALVTTQVTFFFSLKHVDEGYPEMPRARSYAHRYPVR